MKFVVTTKVIKQAQALLIINGHDDDGQLNADGVFGEHTRNALEGFQMQEDLLVTRELDDATLKIMSGCEFEIPDERDGIKRLQAVLILTGFDDNGQLNADGVFGEHTWKMIVAHLLYRNIDNDTFCIDKPEIDETSSAKPPTTMIPTGIIIERADTVVVESPSPDSSAEVDLPSNGEGERNRL
ncbi:MAG: peptidoglycan-binding protein [Candidatus Magasanikbacteria bacterium]|nr:peptidoglycan-binding protein [Candidatus Magasanikbacteria bacterium]